MTLTCEVGDCLWWQNPQGGGFGVVTAIVGPTALVHFQSGAVLRFHVYYAAELVASFKQAVKDGNIVDVLTESDSGTMDAREGPNDEERKDRSTS